ncbi:hypothetical protein LG047_06715 [Methylocystis sp. WRRC1]|uniref:hypothetical protein n=1 Tax=Methylocystis sp. WRRC1 TaxID=1732014 RepID=UPI001D13CBDB|nr:hypothetical protein [Methylocystis sp. WRRC1]MCC3245016.1 hypothetical protein [Methylocystis sp. WRRC1]
MNYNSKNKHLYGWTPFVEVHGVFVTACCDGPYVARSAAEGNENWSYWYVAGPDGLTNAWRVGDANCDLPLGPRVFAEAAANALNEALKAKPSKRILAEPPMARR